MTHPSTNERRPPLHASQPAHRTAARWLAAIVGSVALLLATPALSHAEESNPNNYTCRGLIGNGPPEVGSEEQQVQYTFFCNGPITGYQIQAQIPMTGVGASPLVTTIPAGTPLKDTFSCSGEVPGYAANCVGAAKEGYERVTGEFAIGTKLCAEPRVDPLLTVTYAFSEKGVVTQAISGPFDLGRPEGCKADAYSGSTRLNPKPPVFVHKKKHSKKKAQAKKAAHHKKASSKKASKKK
jgi:hypothetical protein